MSRCPRCERILWPWTGVQVIVNVDGSVEPWCWPCAEWARATVEHEMHCPACADTGCEFCLPGAGQEGDAR